MNTTFLTRNTNSRYADTIPQIMGGIVDIYEEQVISLAIILFHNTSLPILTLEKSLKVHQELGINKIILLQNNGQLPAETIRKKFPRVMFREFEDDNDNLGGLFNTAMSELSADLVFVSWTNIVPDGITASSLMGNNIEEQPLCIVPLFHNNRKIQNTIYIPQKNIFGCKFTVVDDNPYFPYTAFPFEGVGIYNREKFLNIGGFDINISSLHWQLVELGMRTYGKGDLFRLSPSHKVSNDGMRNLICAKDETYNYMCLKHSLGLKAYHIMKYLFSSNTIKYKLSQLWNVLKTKRQKLGNFQMRIKEYWLVKA